MSEFDQLYREVILDHYKNPRGHGLLDAPDGVAEGQNPLCGDEVTVSVALRRRRDDRRGRLRGPWLRDLAGGDVDADRDRVGPERDGGRARCRRRSCSRRSGSRLPRAAQVRDARPRGAEGGAAQVEGHAAADEDAGRRPDDLGVPPSTAARPNRADVGSRKSSGRRPASTRPVAACPSSCRAPP